MDWNHRENIWELKDILKSIDRFLEDSKGTGITEFEEKCIRKGRDEINQTLISLESSA